MLNRSKSNYFHIRRESDNEFILESKMTFDREIQDRYNVEITACDGGKPQRYSSPYGKGRYGSRVQTGESGECPNPAS